MHDIVIYIAKYLIVVPPLLLALVWFRLPWATKRQALIVGVIAAAITGVLAVIGSHLYNDPRPFVAGHFTPYFPHGNDNGFPSDHTLFAALCGSIALLYSRRIGTITLCLAALIGASRVIAGVHHMTDIVGGLLFAYVCVGFAWLIVSKLNSRSKA